MIITFLKARQVNYFLTIHGKAATRSNARDIKDLSTLIFNLTIPQQKNIPVTQIGLEKILEPRWIKMATSILFLMKETINIIFTLLRTTRKLLSQIFLPLSKTRS